MATEVPLIPCINRNLPYIIDVSESGLVAYGSRCSIYILNFRALTIPVIVDSKFIPNAHRGKVISLSFCKTNEELIASVGDDNSVKVWNLETGTCLASLEVKENTCIVEWLHGTATSVSFPGNNSLVTKWNYITNNVVQIRTGSDSFVNILSSNKMSPELLAAGHAVGSISILNVNSQTLMYKLKSHVMEITSLRWSSVSPTMLLSTSSDQTARVWKMGEDKPIRTYIYPRSRKMEDKKHQTKLCGIPHPENQDVIICSNVRGSLGEVTFKDEENPKFVPYDEKNDYTFFNKSINIMLPYLADNNKTLLLTSDHLKISLWDISEKKLRASFAYLNGNIYDLTASTINPYYLAIGAGDGCLRIWNLNETSKLDITTIVLHSRIKIMTVAWHPTAEGLIAYGTDEGRIGVADIQRKKSMYSYETHHSNSVYMLQWAPCLKIKDSEEDFFLYSCGGGIIYIHELNKPKEKPADFDELITYPPDLEFVLKTHTELSWKSDYTCLIVGSFKGFLDLYDSKLNFLTRVTMQMKIVESIKWHPSYTFTSSKGSNYSSWFAAAGNDDNIQIFDTSDIKNGDSESVFCRPTKTLVGHKKKISSLCWSPHSDGYLASTSRDGTVLIWNVISASVVANYPWHQELVYAVHWSYFDPDTVYSGGMDCCLRVWKISEQSQSAPDKCQVIKRKSKPIKPQESNRKESSKEVCIKKEKVEKDSSCKESSDSRSSIDESPEKLEASKTEAVSPKEDCNDKKPKTKFESREHASKMKSLFSGYMLGSKEKKLENVLKLTDLLSSQQLDSPDPENMTLISDKVTEEDSLHFGLYCDQLTAVKMLETKAKVEKKASDNLKSNQLQVMANNIEALLTTAAENKKLSDFHIAASVTISRKFYNEMCKKYAIQLIEEKQYMKASLYLIFCGELHNAVKSLLEKGRILEGLALAKARLPEDDPFVRGALVKASIYFSGFFEFENEAECYLAMKEPSEAAKTLYRRADSSSIYVSAYICKKFNLIEEAELYGYICMEKSLAEAAWPNFYKVIELIDSLKVYKLLVRVHELIFTQIKTLKKDGLLSNNLFGVTGNQLQIWESKAFGDSNISFLPFVYDVLKSENIIPENKESIEEIYISLNSFIAKRQKYETSEEAHISVAVYVSQVIVSSLLNDSSVMERYILKLFPATYNIVFLPRVVFWLFLPFDIHWCSSKDIFICENKYMEFHSSTFPHLQSIYNSMYDKFSSLNSAVIEDFSISWTLPSNLDEAVQQVLSILTTKTAKDSWILYFSICYINEMKRLAKNGWKFRCYDSAILYDTQTEQVASEDNNKSIVHNEKNSEKATVCNDHRNIKKHDIESDVNCNENALLSEKDINMQNEIISSQNKNDILFMNCTTPLVEDNNLAASNSLISGDDDNITNTENASTLNGQGKLKHFLNPISVNDDTTKENGLTDNVNNEIEPSKEVEDKIAPEKYGDGEVKGNSLTNNINGNVEGSDVILENMNNGTVEKALPESIFNSAKVEETYSEVDDDHLQCWSDVSFFYVLTKSFTAVNCRDEYALFFYIQKYLHHLDNAIADITRQKSSKSVLNNPKELVCVTEDEKCLSNQNICSDSITVEKDHQENNLISNSLKDVETSDFPKENDSNCNGDNDCFMLEKEIKNESDENKVKNNSTVNNDVRNELTDKTNAKTTSEESGNHSKSVLHEKIDLTEEQLVLENLQSEHEKVSQLLKLFNSVEINYPNPFDAVSAINHLCCDIFHKHPCNLVKKKFHNFIHDVYKWNAKFCIKDETVTCDVCKEIICA